MVVDLIRYYEAPFPDGGAAGRLLQSLSCSCIREGHICSPFHASGRAPLICDQYIENTEAANNIT